MDPTILWTTPAPLWPETANPTDAAARSVFRQPAILRFASDAFMDEFMAMMDADPSRMSELRARPETWLCPAPSLEPIKALPKFALNLDRQGLVAVRAAKSVTQPSNGSGRMRTDPNQPLKLYHPAHQRFYLVTACLVCQTTGLPDRVVDTANEERVTFVVRRLRPRLDVKGWDEYAFVATPRGPAWRKVLNGATLASGEEQLPLFPVTFTAGDGRKRRLFAGIVPVGKREAYLGAPATNEAVAAPAEALLPPPQVSPREALLISQVIEPWNNLIDLANRTVRKITAGQTAAATGSAKDKEEALREAVKLATTSRNQIQTSSWYVLLDFAHYLKEHVPDVWEALNDRLPANPLIPEGQTLVSALKNIQIAPDFASALTNSNYLTADVVTSLSDALVMSMAREDREQYTDKSLERITAAYDRAGQRSKWPDFLFPLADVDMSKMYVAGTPPNTNVVGDPILRVPQLTGAQAKTVADFNNVEELADFFKTNVDGLRTKIVAALPSVPSAPLPPVLLAAQLPIDAGDPGYFVIRCVFERPNCGPIQAAIVSDPAPVIHMAPFFDPEAPARPIRISLPMDTTPAGLRKFDKNTAFMMSDVLCKQMDGLCNISLGDLVLSVLPWPFHKDLSLSSGGLGGCKDGSGMVCSFSIPIITICAVIILMMIVKLLDLVFNWMSFFRVCFELPKFVAKR